MMRGLRVSFLACLLCLSPFAALTASGQSKPPEGLTKLNMEVPAATRRAALVSHYKTSQILHVAISLPPADLAGLESFVDSVSNPKNPNYGHFLTPEEVGTRFGLPLNTVNRVSSYLKANGFSVKLVAKNHLSILADCTVAQAEAAFHTRIDQYKASPADLPGDGSFFAYSQPPSLPSDLAPSVLYIEGLENFTRPQHRAITPTQARTLYNLAPIYNAGLQGQGRTVGISSFDGFRLSNVPLFYAQYGLPTPAGGVGSNITVVPISGGMGTGATNVEGDLDIQMVLGMAPLCNLIVYDGGGWNLFGVLTQETNDNQADVISESYGWSIPSFSATSYHNLHLSMSAQGITYMAASGDTGTNLQGYDYPNIDPEVLAIGGTVATTNSGGTRTSEVGWSGSGGGWSTNTAPFNTLPSYQTGTGVPTSIPYRLFPDVSLNAGAAYQFYYNGSLTSGYLGTSFACPVMAGALAVAEQKIINGGGLPPDGSGHRRFGRIQDLVYSQNGRSDVWHDITSGSNGTLPNGSTSTATVGWDMVTGWGTIDFNAFAATQVNSTPDFTFAALPASQTVVQGANTTYTATVTAINGFTGTTNLTVTGLPTGAGSSFSPTSLSGTGSSTLTVTTANNTPTGSYTLTLTGTSGSLVHSATVTLVVNPAPDFTIGAAPSSQTVVQGNSTSYTTTITAQNGFNSATALTVTGLPSGAGSSFTPASVTGSGTSTLSVTTAANTPTGTYTLTLTGTSGSLVHSTTVTLNVNAPADFGIAATPSSQTVVQGNSTNYTTTITGQNGFNAATALSLTGLPAGAGSNFSSATVTGSGTSTLTVTTANNTPTGTYTLTITGTSGSLVHSTTVTLIVNAPADFAIAASPSSQTVVQGNSTSYTTTLTAQNGFNAATALTLTGLPAGAGSSFTPASVTGSGTSTLTVTTSNTTPAGTYTLTITGTSGSLVHSTTVSLVVNQPPDFSIAATPSSQTVVQGDSTSYTATLTALHSFNAATALTVTGLPSGAGSSFTPSSVTGSGTSTLNVTTANNTPAGTYTLTITGTSGNLVHSTTVTLVVNQPPDFSIACAPGSQAVVQGNSATFTTTVTALHGFNAATALTITGLPSGAGASFTPSSVTGSGTSSLTVTTANTTPAGSYTLTITGTSGNLVHSATVTLIVNQPPDFNIGATPASQSVVQGSGTSYVVTVSGLNNFNSATGLVVTGLPAGASGQLLPASITGSGSSTLSVSTGTGTPVGTYTLTITGTSGNIVHSTSVSLTVTGTPDFSFGAAPSSQSVVRGSSTSYVATVSGSNGFNGAVALSFTGLPSGATAHFTPTSVTGSGSSTLSVTTSTSTPVGSYTLTLTGVSGSLRHSATVLLVVTNPPDFTLGATPSSQSVPQGESVGYQASVSALNGFNGTVSLSVTGLPSGTSASFAPSTIAGQGGSLMTITALSTARIGTYSLTITAVSGSLRHTKVVTLVVTAPRNFSLSISPSSKSVVQGLGTTFTTTVHALNGFGAGVNLSVTGLPAGAQASFSPTSVNGAGNSVLTITTSTTTPTGSFRLVITGTSGNLVHTVTALLTITPHPDFAIAVSPTSRSITRGTSTTFTASITAKNGFTGAVNFSVAGLPDGANGTFSRTSLVTSGSTVLTVATTTGLAPGTYTITITGTSASWTHSVNAVLTVH